MNEIELPPAQAGMKAPRTGIPLVGEKTENVVKYAGIHERGGKVFIRSQDKTVAGTHFAQDNVLTLDATDHGGVGTALKVALKASREAIPIPPREAMAVDAPSALYPAAGVRNWREFARGAKYLTADQGDGQITLVPWKNEGVRATFVPLKGRNRTISDTSTDSDIGAAVIAGLADAE
jgi:hypothetical protein